MAFRFPVRMSAFAGLVGASALFAAPASADYMGTCTKLIENWKTCVSTSGSGACGVQQTKIETECKCHSLKGGEWKLVMAAVAESNVCGSPIPEDKIGEPEPDPTIFTPRNHIGGGAPAGRPGAPEGGEQRGAGR